MRRAGEVVRVAQGKLVARVPATGADHVAVGTALVDEELDAAGRVVDVFGPVARPYLAVVPAEGVRPADLLGARLYARE
jgi:RNA-binding protein